VEEGRGIVRGQLGEIAEDYGILYTLDYLSTYTADGDTRLTR